MIAPPRALHTPQLNLDNSSISRPALHMPSFKRWKPRIPHREDARADFSHVYGPRAAASAQVSHTPALSSPELQEVRRLGVTM